MYRHVVRIGARRNLEVPIALMICHVSLEHLQDGAVEAFRLPVFLQVVGAREGFRHPHHLVDPHGEARSEF